MVEDIVIISFFNITCDILLNFIDMQHQCVCVCLRSARPLASCRALGQGQREIHLSREFAEGSRGEAGCVNRRDCGVRQGCDAASAVSLPGLPARSVSPEPSFHTSIYLPAREVDLFYPPGAGSHRPLTDNKWSSRRSQQKE